MQQALTRDRECGVRGDLEAEAGLQLEEGVEEEGLGIAHARSRPQLGRLRFEVAEKVRLPASERVADVGIDDRLRGRRSGTG